MTMKKITVLLMLAICTNAYGTEQRDSVITQQVKTEKAAKKAKKPKKLSKKEKAKLLMKSNKPAGYVEPSAEDRRKDSIAGTTNIKLY